MSKKVVISCDSIVDLSEDIVKRYGIVINPMPVTVGEKQYFDGVDVHPEDLFKYTRETGELAKTSAPNTAAYAELFGKLTADGAEVVHFTISASMSGSYNFARLAAEETKGVYVVDSANLSTGSGLLALKACDMAAEGMSAEQIAAEIEEIKPRVDASFVADTLNYLHKGGRCSAVAMFGANLLNLKPCIEVTDGAMGVGKKYRGKIRDVLKAYTEDRLAFAADAEADRVFVTSTCESDDIPNEIAEMVRASGFFKEVIITKAGCTVSAHCGPNTLGVLFIRNSAKG